MLHAHLFTPGDFNRPLDSAISEGREGEVFELAVSFVHSHEYEGQADEHDHPLTVAVPVTPVRGVSSVVSFRHVVA